MKKNATITTTRVIATILILICHVIKYYTFIPGHNQLGQFFNVGVPIFIIISGYLYGGKYASEKFGGNAGQLDLRLFIRDRYLRVAFPSQIWALVILLVTGGTYLINTFMVLLNLQGISWIIKGISIPNGGPYLAHSWFVTVILIC